MDTFLGLDISIDDEEPSARPSKSQQRKRPRPKSSAAAVDAAAKRPKRPAPTPAPPAALVSLIQKDSAVLKYFKSLQANLDYDVDKWKAEAKMWKEIARDNSRDGLVPAVKRPARTNGKNGEKRSSSKKKDQRTDKNVLAQSDSFDEHEIPASNTKLEYNNKEGADDESNIPITDEALFGGSDESSAAQSSCYDENLEGATQEQNNSLGSNTRASVVLEKLKDAQKCLHLLGVSLVEVEVKTINHPPAAVAAAENTNETTPESSDMHKDNPNIPDATNVGNSENNFTNTIERILHRQSDETVIGDIMASLKTLIKTSLTMTESEPVDVKRTENDTSEDERMDNKEDESLDVDSDASNERVFWTKMRRQYHPFCHDGRLHVPAVYVPVDNTHVGDCRLPQHPAAVGLNHVIEILSIMGMYCSDDLSDGEWDSIFERVTTSAAENSNPYAEEELMILKLGMRNRCRITERVLSSLHVEITRGWAMTDREAFLTEPTLFFHESDVIEFDDEPQTTQNYHAKVYNRLVSMEGRIAHARIATILTRERDDWQKAAELLIGYVVSSAPSIAVENYPKLPPTLSLCVLEALLSSRSCASIGNGSKPIITLDEGWFPKYIEYFMSVNNDSKGAHRASQLLNAIAYPICAAALIWKARSLSTDDRIREIALVELAAFQRIQQSADALWINKVSIASLNGDAINAVGSKILDSVLTVQDSSRTDSNVTTLETLDTAMTGISSALSLLTMGDVDRVVHLFGEASKHMSNLPLFCSIYASLMSRKWDTLKLSNVGGRPTAAAFTVIDRFSPILLPAIQLVSPTNWQEIESLLRCCVLMSDGRNLLRIAKDALPSLLDSISTQQNNRVTLPMKQSASRVLSIFIDIGELPTVRLINLRRRRDRLLDFMSFASKEQLVVIQGPIAAMHQHSDNKDCIGDFAFDGKCTDSELKSMVSLRLGGNISDFVSAKWRPSDLRAFDRGAPKNNDLVQLSLTEKACSLSHIASWIGVQRSLSEHISADAVVGKKRFCHDLVSFSPLFMSSTSMVGNTTWYQRKLIRMLKISGFARGEALLPVNKDNDPAPCCVVLEDDACLCDRFSERLEALLEELPRDFHFCSIGYSRPQRAPIVEYSTQLGIPSCLWYLTGYIISLEGANYLLESLPVVGPGMMQTEWFIVW